MNKLILLLMLFLFCAGGHSQTLTPKVILTTGGASSVAGGTVSWTIGETVTATLTSGTTILSQGQQQPEIDILSGTITDSPFCAGAAVSVPFIASGYYDVSNVFTAQLSNGSGSFNSPLNIGTLTSTGSGTITATFPSNTASGTGYRIRVVSNLPNYTGLDNAENITINALTAITSQSTASQTQCIGGAFTAVSVSATGTGTLTYQWYRNTTASTNGGFAIGSGVGGTSTPFTPQLALAGTWYLYCKVTGTCGTATSAVSEALIRNPVTAISSQSTTTQTQCVNGTFKAISVSATGSGLTYQWYSNSSESNSEGASLGSANGSQTNSYTPQAASAGTHYYYCVVTGTCGTATSAVSGAIIVNTCAPATPVSLIATPGNASVSIAFTAGPDGGAAITNYEYSTDNGTTWTACSPAMTASPVTISGLTNGTTYQVKLRAINTLGTGTVSSTVSVTPRTTPGMPIQLTATEANGSATISFTAGSNGGSAITNYRYSTDNGATWADCSPATISGPITITGLTNGLTYKVKVWGVNGAGSGAPSAFISIKPNNTFTWIGGDEAGKNDWNNPKNWDTGSVPASTDNVVIPQVTDKPQIGSSLSVATNGKMTINANSQIEVTGSVQNSGTILIKSDPGGTGSLITSNLASGAGQALVERYMAQNEWHIISSPTGTQTIQDFLADNIDIPTVSGTTPVQYGLMDFDPASGQWNPYFTDLTSGTLGVGKGYMVRIQDPVQTLRFQGTINTTADASVSKGWNCIGNPFTSAININSNADATNNFMTINATSFEANYAGLYFWNQTDNKYDVINNASPSYKASIGQGFFMKVKQGVSSVSFTPIMQAHQVDAPFKSTSVVNSSIKLKVQSDTNVFTTDILFIDGTTKGLDFGYDAGLFTTDKSFSLYTRLMEDNGTNFQLQCLPTNGFDKMVIPLGLDSKAGGEIVFTVQTVQLVQDCKVILEDKLTNTFTDLSTRNYKAAVTANTAGMGRFYLHTSDIISGLEDQVLPGKVTAYTNGNTEIRVVGEVGDGAVATLFNGLGKVVLRKRLGSGNLNIIGIPYLNSGVYLLNINDKGTPQTIKIMVRK